MAGKNYQLAFQIGGKVSASLPKSFNEASRAILSLNEQLNTVKEQRAAVQKLEGMKQKVGQTALEYHKAAERVKELQKELSATEAPTKKMTREFERAKTQSSNLRDTLRKQRDELAKLKRSYDGADTSARALASRNKELAASADRNRAAQIKAIEQVQRYKTALAESSRNVKDAKRSQDEYNKSLAQRNALQREKYSEAKGKLTSSAVQTAAGGAGVFMAAKKAADFNRENQLIGNTADMTKKEVVAMGQAMLKTANQTGQFAGDIQAAQGYLVAAGQNYKTAQANLFTIGKTATGTGSEILDVAKATFTLEDALKINPSQMQTALDILVQSGKEGNFEFNDMAKTLPILGAQFQALKMGGTEAAATMGAALQIARKGASTSDEAANNMNNFMAKILSPETLKKASKNFNVDLYSIIQKAQKGGKNPFEAAMQEVMKMTKGGDQKLLGELFGDMQVQNFVRPMIQNFEEYKAIKKKALAASGVVDKDFEIMMKENAQGLKNLQISTDNAANSFGQALQPALNKTLAIIVPLITKMSEWVANNPALVSQITLTVGAVLSFRTAILACKVAMFALGVATKMTPFGWIQLAIMGAVAAGTYLYQNWDAIKAYAKEAWPKIKEYGVSALNFLKDVFMNFTPVGWLIQAFQAGKDILTNIDWSGSGKAIIQTLIDGVKAKASALIDEVKGVFDTVREYLPFSDAKVGPFSDLTKSGSAIIGTLAAGVKSNNSLPGAVAGQFSQVPLANGGIASAGKSFSRQSSIGPGSMGAISYSPIIHLPAGSGAETRAAVDAGLKAGADDFERRLKSVMTQQQRLNYA